MPSPTPSLTPSHVVEHVRRHCFEPCDGGRVGIEIELHTMPAGRPHERPPIAELRSAVAALTPPQGSAVTLEPGGQVELSSRPHAGPAAAIAAAQDDLDAVRAGLAAAGITTDAAGLDHRRPPERIVGGGRYDAMESYFCAGGPQGMAMMCGTASVQVNLDLGVDAAALGRRWRLAHHLGPVLVASFANSPLGPDGPTGTRSARQQLWSAIDPSRGAPVADGGRDGTGCEPAETWARYAMEAGVMMIRTGCDRFVPLVPGTTFRTWMADGHPLGYPTVDDLDYHLTTLFPPVRPKGWLELRMIDAVPDPWWQVAVAVTAALFDDPWAFEEAERVCRPAAGRWAEAARSGLCDPALAASARACFAAAVERLPALGVGPALVDAAADYAERYVARARTPGDDLLDGWLHRDDSPRARTGPGRPGPSSRWSRTRAETRG